MVLGGRKSEARRRILLGCLFNFDENVRWRQLFFVRTDGKIILGQSVGKITIIIPGFGSEFVDSGFQKYPLANNISAFVKGMKATRLLYFNLNSKVVVTKTCQRKLRMKATTSFYSLIQWLHVYWIFFFFFYQFFCNLEEKLIVKEWLYIREISITVLWFAKNQARLGPYDKKIKLPLPYETKQKYWQRGFNINFYQLSLRCDYYKLEDLLEIALR